MNQVFLQARVVEVQSLRFTPAGLPILELVLDHGSDVVEAGHQRRIVFTIAARALGSQATQLQFVAIGQELRIEGFLATTRKNSSKLVLHIQAVSFPTTNEFSSTYLV